MQAHICINYNYIQVLYSVLIHSLLTFSVLVAYHYQKVIFNICLDFKINKQVTPLPSHKKGANIIEAKIPTSPYKTSKKSSRSGRRFHC